MVFDDVGKHDNTQILDATMDQSYIHKLDGDFVVLGPPDPSPKPQLTDAQKRQQEFEK